MEAVWYSILGGAIGYVLAVLIRLARERRRKARRRKPGVLVSDRRLTETKYEELKAKWLREHGNNQTAHHVTESYPTIGTLNGEEQP
jgi:hypothetical protein